MEQPFNSRPLQLVHKAIPGGKDRSNKAKDFPLEVTSKITYALEVRLSAVQHLGMGLATLMLEGEEFAQEVNEAFEKSSSLRSLRMHIVWSRLNNGEFWTYIPQIAWFEKIVHADLQGFEHVQAINATPLEFNFSQRKEVVPNAMTS